MNKRVNNKHGGQIRNEILGPARGSAEQLDMECRVRCQILFGLLALLQFGCAVEKQPEKDYALMLQTKVENLIEKILQVIEDYYHQIRTELKCIPDEIPDTIVGTLKRAIDCVDQNERTYDSGQITANAHKKAFLKCFSDAKTEVEETITSIDPSLDYCPENMTEKTYQINVTTTFTKTFHINIKNGLEIMKKKVDLGNGEQICVFNQGEHQSGNANQTAQDNEPMDYISDEDSSGADENKVTDLQSKEHYGKGHESKGHHGKGHHINGKPEKGHESKDDYGLGEEEENLLGISDNAAGVHGGNDSSNADKNVHHPVEHDNGHGSKEHQGKGPESKESFDNDHKPKEQHGTGPEPKESLTQGHDSKEHPDDDHKSKEHHGKFHESKINLTLGHESKEHPQTDHKPKEHHGKGHESKESTTQEHESKESTTEGHDSKEHPDSYKPKEHHGKGHETKVRPQEGHESKESTTEGHESKEHLENDHQPKEHHGKGHETKVRPHEGHEPKESTTKGHVPKEYPGKGHEPKEHYGKGQPSKENPTESPLGASDWGDEYGDEYGGNDSSNEDDVSYEPGQEIDDDSDLDNPSKELPGYGGASNYDDDDDDENENGYANGDEYDEDENEDINRPDWAQDNDKDSDEEGYRPASPDSEGYHGNDDESKDYGYGPSSAQQPEDNEGSQVNDYNGYEDDDADDDADDDEDVNLLEEDATTPPPGKLAMGSPTEKPFDRDYYADPDTEPEYANYGNEYYDASEKEKSIAENPDKPLGQKLGQSKPAPPVAQRIQIKPKNQVKHKPKKRPQNSERHKITLPKTWPKKPPPRISSQSITSLSQSFLQSDF